MGAVKTETIKRTLTDTIRMSAMGNGKGSFVRAALGSTGRQEGGRLRYLKPIPAQVGSPGGLGSGACVGPR